MSTPAPLSSEHQRYLRLLQVEPSPPSLALLSQLVAAQIIQCPFENLSKLLARNRGVRRLPALGEFLEGIERHHLGGTCYVNNHAFYGLLQALGFDASFCAADMSQPDVHTVVVVRVEGRELLVDAGFAAPFFEPMPLDVPDPLRISWGNEGYVLWPKDADGRTRLDHLRDGVRVHGYTVKPGHRPLSDFEGVIRESYADSATFMNALRFERFSRRGSVSLYNHVLRVIEDGRCTFHELPGREDVLDALVERLGVARELAASAMEGLGPLKSVHG